MSESLLTDDVASLLETVLTESSSDLYAVNPSTETIDELISVTAAADSPPTVKLLAAERPLKDIMEDFIVGSRAANLVDEGHLELRTLSDTPKNSLLITDEEVITIVTADDSVAGLRTDDAEFVESVLDRYERAWQGADEFSLRTPPLSEVRNTLASDIGEPTARDFDEVLSSLQTARGNGNGLDEVTISLLVAAKNGELLYDISKWGEDIGLASKATFSRTKTKLEDMGLIDTEKVPIDVGRPRLRLMLGDERLQNAEADQLASVAQTILSS